MAQMIVKGKEREKKLEFFLKQSDGVIVLKCEDNDGSIWSVLEINDRGKCYLYNGLPKDVGLKTDENNCIILE